MKTVWFIENEKEEWYSKSGNWTKDPLKAMMFNKDTEAHLHAKIFVLNFKKVTEHEFVDKN